MHLFKIAEHSAGPGFRGSRSQTGATSGAAKSTFRIRSDEFGPDVRRARSQLEGGSAALVEYPAEGCLAVSVEPGSEVVATTYDAAPAALVLRPPSGDRTRT